MKKNIFCILCLIFFHGMCYAEVNVFEKIDEIGSEHLILKRQHELDQLRVEEERLRMTIEKEKRQAEIDRMKQEIERMDNEIKLDRLRKEKRDVSTVQGDPKVQAIMGMVGNLEATLVFTDGSIKIFKTGDVLPGGGEILGITEFEVLVGRGKELVSLAHEKKRNHVDTGARISVHQPQNQVLHSPGRGVIPPPPVGQFFIGAE